MYRLASPEIGAALGQAFLALPAYRVVIAAGEFRGDLSDIGALRDAGVEVGSLGQMLESPPAWLTASFDEAGRRDDDVIIALNTALMTAGVALRLPEGN